VVHRSRGHARAAVFAYIDRFYSLSRLRTMLGRVHITRFGQAQKANVGVNETGCRPGCDFEFSRQVTKVTDGGIGPLSGWRSDLRCDNLTMTTDSPVSIGRRSTGFTLIELLVTLALAAILGSLAAPAVRDFIVRSKLTNLSAEFTGSVLKARNEAVNRNTCVTMCMSSSAGDAAPACTTTGTDWQVGWIAFLNPTCDSGANSPTDSINMLLARPNMGSDFYLQTQNNRKKITFNARGGAWVK
jgi:type IV fimbrial biogenesis protein FimT